MLGWTLALAAAMPSRGAGASSSSFTHGWGCVLGCGNGSMLAGLFGTRRPDFGLDDPWWVEALAEAYGVVMLNGFDSSPTDPVDPRIALLAKLKQLNPSIKTMLYFPIDRAGDNDIVLDQLKAHPEWFVRDDYGNVLPFHNVPNGHPFPNYSIPACQDWYANLGISLFASRGEAAALLDGALLDGDGYTALPNTSAARSEALYAGMLATTAKMRAALGSLNGGAGGGEVIINSGVWCTGNTGSCRSPEPMINAGTGLFDEMFGSFETMVQASGEWDPVLMRTSFDTIATMIAAGKTVFIHAFPGPAGGTEGSEGMFPVRGNTTVGSTNTFRVAQWAGSERVPQSAEGCRAAAAARVVESLAPFLIVANERTFLSYAWFYNLEDGYIPCQGGSECGMPAQWYPEFRRPIGAPKGPATTDATRTVWRREFEHARVYVDLTNRSASRIDWS